MKKFKVTVKGTVYGYTVVEADTKAEVASLVESGEEGLEIEPADEFEDWQVWKVEEVDG